jgi:hypothetical protein
MLRFLADENFNGRIVRGLLRRLPELDIVRAQDLEALYQAIDPVVLQWAADEQRVVLSHDISTMPGLFEVHSDLPVGQAIEDLVLLAEASLPGEWEGQVRFLLL